MTHEVLGTLIAMKGLPRSGKSTIAKQLSKEISAPIVSKDNIRLALHGKVYESLAEPFVRAISKVMVHSLFLSGHPVVIADETHYSRAARDFMSDGPWLTTFYVVPTSPEICHQRATDTNQPWLHAVIDEMTARHEPLGDGEIRFQRSLNDGSWTPKQAKTATYEVVQACPKCQQFNDTIDRMIYHDNGHVWPGFAGEPL